MAGDAPSDGLGPGQLVRRWLADLGDESGDVLIARFDQLLTAHLSTDSLLQELGCVQSAALHLLVEVLWQVHLHPRHAPNHT